MACAPERPGHTCYVRIFGLGCRLCVNNLAVRRCIDANGAGLHGLRNLTHQVNVQETVLELRRLHFDKVGKPKYALKRPSRNALIKNFRLPGIGYGLLLALHRQCVFLCLNGKLGLRESRDRDGDAIGVLVRPFDVVRRVGRTAFEARRFVEQRKQPVKPDGRAIKRGKIECTHGISSFEATCISPPVRARQCLCSRDGLHTCYMGSPIWASRVRKCLPAWAMGECKLRLSASLNADSDSDRRAVEERLSDCPLAQSLSVPTCGNTPR